MPFYFIMCVVCSVAGVILFIIFNDDKKSYEDYILISIASMCISLIWPLEIIATMLFFIGMWANSIKKQIEERKNK